MPVARSGGAQLGESLVDFRSGDRTALDIDQLMDVAPVEPDNAVFGVDGNAVAITVGQRREDHRMHGRLRQAADPSHRLFDLFRLQFQLVLVADMLVSTAPASSEVWASGSYATRRRIEEFNQFAFGKLLFFADDFRGDALALDRKRNKDRFAFIPADPLAAKRDIFDLDFHLSHGADSNVEGAFAPRHYATLPGSRGTKAPPTLVRSRRLRLLSRSRRFAQRSGCRSLRSRHRVFDRGLELPQVHRLDQMFGEAGLHALLDIPVHPEAADGDAADLRCRAQADH